jgi:hypothetical protein
MVGIEHQQFLIFSHLQTHKTAVGFLKTDTLILSHIVTHCMKHTVTYTSNYTRKSNMFIYNMRLDS